MVEKHNTTFHSDGGKPELFQVRCSCGFETGYMPAYSAKSADFKHRKKHSK